MARRKKGGGEAALIMVVIVVGLIAKAAEFVMEHKVAFSICGAILFGLWFFARHQEKKERDAAIAEANRLSRAKELEKEEAKRVKEEEKRKKEEERLLAKEAKERNKKQAAEAKEAQKVFSKKTVDLFGLGKAEYKSKPIEKTKHDLQFERLLVSNSNIKFFDRYMKPNNQSLDSFLLNGNYNSILGIEGIKNFRIAILEHISEQINNEQEILNINVGELKNIVFKTGIYFEYEFAPAHIKKLEDEYEWRSFHKLLIDKDIFSSINDLDLGLCQEKFPKHFKKYTETDVRSLTIAIDAATTELHQALLDYLNNQHKFSYIAA